MTMINIQTIARHKYSDRNTIRTITQDKLSKIILSHKYWTAAITDFDRTI